MVRIEIPINQNANGNLHKKLQIVTFSLTMRERIPIINKIITSTIQFAVPSSLLVKVHER